MPRLKDATRSGEFESARDKGGTVIADFFTKACVLCRKVEPMLAALANGAGETLAAFRIDAEENRELAVEYEVHWVYTSGMGGLDPATGQVVCDDVIEQTRQSIRNVEAILAAAGCTLQDVVKAVVYLTDMADYPRVNAVYEEAFAPNRPARTCVAVSALPVRERMKIETVAFKGRP